MTTAETGPVGDRSLRVYSTLEKLKQSTNQDVSYAVGNLCEGLSTGFIAYGLQTYSVQPKPWMINFATIPHSRLDDELWLAPEILVNTDYFDRGMPSHVLESELVRTALLAEQFRGSEYMLRLNTIYYDALMKQADWLDEEKHPLVLLDPRNKAIDRSLGMLLGEHAVLDFSFSDWKEAADRLISVHGSKEDSLTQSRLAWLKHVRDTDGDFLYYRAALGNLNVDQRARLIELASQRDSEQAALLVAFEILEVRSGLA